MNSSRALPIDEGPTVHPGWSRAGWVWLLWVAMLLVSAGSAAGSMVKIWWHSGTFNHALAVAPLSIWLAWRARARWLPLQPRFDLRWWPLLVLGSVGLLVSELALVNSPGHFGWVLALVVSVPLLWGTAVARQLTFPLGFLFFMVPVGEFLMPSMMEATASFTVWALRLSGVPVFREGLDFVIPSGSWSVVEACSGIRYLVASACVGALFAHLNYRRWYRRLLFFSLSLVVPVVANWVRAYLIVMLGHLSDNRLAAGVDHLIYGWVFFGLVMALLFALGAKWADSSPPQGDLVVMEAPGQAVSAAGLSSKGVPSAEVWAVVVLSGIFTVAGPSWALRAWWHDEPHSSTWSLPVSSGSWNEPQRVDVESLDWRPLFQGANLEQAVRYEAQGAYQGRSVTVHHAAYWAQEASRRMPMGEWALDPADGDRWQVLSGGRSHLGWISADGRELVAQARLLREKSRSPGQPPAQLLQVQLLRVDGQWELPGWRARWRLARARLAGRSDIVESWTLVTDAGSGVVESDRVRLVESFVKEVLMVDPRRP